MERCFWCTKSVARGVADIEGEPAHQECREEWIADQCPHGAWAKVWCETCQGAKDKVTYQ